MTFDGMTFGQVLPDHTTDPLYQEYGSFSYYAGNVATVSLVLAGGLYVAGYNPWLGTAGIHGPHHGLGTHFEVIIRGWGGRNFKLIIPGRDHWIWFGFR
jgi:hypothetical protein